MRQLTCSIVLLLGCACTASAALAAASADGAVAASFSQLASAPAVPASGLLLDAEAPTPHGPVSTYLIRKFGVAKQKAQQISDAVTLASAKYSLPPAVLLAIISIESRFREKAKGANGATGLMQVVPSVHRGLVRNQDLTEPTTNIKIGSAILYGYMQGANGDLDVAMRRYGGSQAYAQKIRVRAAEFNRALDTDAQPDAPASEAETRHGFSRARP
ncbi:transglycosylase SLT domain-containing protein [Burkholderia sp. 22PA0099]|uniref:transglycosylase SLT domain-containing protein n=1 Tax=Burkholderia sp. 22PA0099 TaxID=3237372 RepID=UPI0039C16396